MAELGRLGGGHRNKGPKIFGKFRADIGATQSHLHRRFEKAYGRTRVVPGAVKLEGIRRLPFQKYFQRIGDLISTELSRLRAADRVEDLRRQNVAADDPEVRWRVLSCRLFNQILNLIDPVAKIAAIDDAVLGDLRLRDVLDSKDATVEAVVDIQHLLDAGSFRFDECRQGSKARTARCL